MIWTDCETILRPLRQEMISDQAGLSCVLYVTPNASGVPIFLPHATPTACKNNWCTREIVQTKSAIAQCRPKTKPRRLPSRQRSHYCNMLKHGVVSLAILFMNIGEALRSSTLCMTIYNCACIAIRCIALRSQESPSQLYELDQLTH